MIQNWFNNLHKPILAPPAWIFKPVWIILYITIMISIILYIFKNGDDKKIGYIYFSIQLILNLLWAPVFFVFKNIFLAFLIIILMDIFIFLTMKKFYKVSKMSAVILLPYFLWVLFASYLNLGYLILN